MDDPLKIIFKYKNNNRRIQYHTYIFVGDIDQKIIKILKKIQEQTYYDSLIILTNDENNILLNYYGAKWYLKFFNTYHINFIIDTIKNNKKQQTELINKYGEPWYEENIRKFTLIDKKIYYSYESIIKDEIIRKEQKRKRTQLIEEEEEVDYTTIQKPSVNEIIFEQNRNPSRQDPQTVTSEQEGGNIEVENYEDGELTVNLMNKMAKYDFKLPRYPINQEQQGGQYGLVDNNDRIDDTNINELIKEVNTDDEDENYKAIENFKTLKKEADLDKDTEIEFDEGLEVDQILEGEDELDIEDIEKLYQDNEGPPDEDIIQTSNLIQKALNDDNIFKKMEKSLIDFDISKDDLMYDDHLKNVYYKNYVTTQYIFKDDTIITIKKKICCSIKNNPKFEKESLIAPTRQYLWSEYFYNEKLEKIMIGQKWIKRSDILNIDVEPNNNMRIYEELRGNLKFLRDNIRRYGSKIKREDDDFNILYDYENYYTNNEIYMIDVYNELGTNYNPESEALRNVTDVFIRIYFPRINTDDVKYIVEYLNGDIKVESNKLKILYETISNDLIIENEIMKTVEQTKKTSKYKYLFKENYITQSDIHVNLKTRETSRIDPFRIFNEFKVNTKYPFIQYRTLDGQIIFKYSEKDISEFSSNKTNIDVLSKWFENAPYGISFKVRITERAIEKFMAINLSDNGRIEFKTQWKEEHAATTEDIKKTYEYVKDLVEKLNGERNKANFDIPTDNEFKYAYINTIQKFELPEKFIINHNDLSEFSRYFYPYISLVIEPKKRQSKIRKNIEKSKYGTYLRYKRVSKYENKARIEQRVLYFLRNYDYNDVTLTNEISKQFNMTLERAQEEIKGVKNKYPNIKKSRKILKKLENVPKYKPPGIGIDIQGKQRDKYKIRISGARNNEQLDRIITFMNILIYLYVETYLYKRSDKQVLKEKLKKLTTIAKRRNQVAEVVNYEKNTKTIKQMAQLDKKRIGFKPGKDQNGWTRSCQNSGNDKKRRPVQIVNVDDLIRQGFKLNDKYGVYEKKVQLSTKSGKKKETLIRAAGMETLDEEGNPIGTIYYSCSPTENGDHTYVGFLSRSNNPYGECMPCCFKKDPLESKNKEKKDYYMKCIGKLEKVEKQQIKPTGDKLYILQDTNKIQEGRIGFLPKYLDYFFNKMLNKSRKIKQHYLIAASTGYYFKYGSIQNEQIFLNAISSALDEPVESLIDKIIARLEKDKSEILFTALNNGDIRTGFTNKEKYIDFIKQSTNLGFDSINHILCIPGVIKPYGMNIVVFKKETIVISKTLEKEKIIDDFVILCQNPEETNNLVNPKRETIILVKENKNYYPIVLVVKRDDLSKNFIIIRKFIYEKTEENIIHHFLDFYERNCTQTLTGKDLNTVTAKDLFKILVTLDNKEYAPQYQIIDTRNKCKYIVTNNSTILPIRPSGSIYNLQILKNIETKLFTLQETIDRLNNLDKISKGETKMKPIGVYYDHKVKNKITVIGVMAETYQLVPIKPETILIDQMEKKGFKIEYRQLFDKVDIEISKHSINKIDERIEAINYDKYYNESYELFRLHLSEFINDPDNSNLKAKIERIIIDKSMKKKDRRIELQKLLFRLIDKNLYTLFMEEKIKPHEPQTLIQTQTSQVGGKYSRFIHVLNTLPDLNDYEINNNREVCMSFNNKDKCEENIQCHWSYDSCTLGLIREMIITFINKVSEELVSGTHKAFEILRKLNYFVSDIADYSSYKERPGQIIIKSTNNTINKVLTELFGKDNIPKIGKRRIINTNVADLQEMNVQHPMNNMGEYVIQKIIEENMSLFRGFSNGYHWLKQIYYDIESRNLGYYSNLQTDMTNYFRSNVIDWVTEPNNYQEIEENLADLMEINKKNFIMDFVNKISKDVTSNTNGLVELYVLNKIYNITIIVYDKYNTILYIVDNGIIYNKFNNDDIENKKYNKYKDINNLRNIINLRFVSMSMANIPIAIEVAFYK